MARPKTSCLDVHVVFFNIDVDQVAPVKHYFLMQFFQLQQFSNEKFCTLYILKMMFAWSFYGKGKDRRKEEVISFLTIFNLVLFYKCFQLNTGEIFLYILQWKRVAFS